MRIGLDATMIVPGRTGGMETYVRELLHALDDIGVDDEFTLFTRAGASEALRPACGRIGCVELPQARGAPDLFVMQRWLPAAAAHARVEVLHHLANVACRATGFRSVLTLHDLTLHRYAEEGHSRDPRVWFHLWTHLSSARGADRVITVSRASARDIEAVAGVSACRIDVVPLAARHFPGAADDGEPPVEPGYFLALGGSDPHKNLHRLVAAHAASSVRRPLVVAGVSPAWRDSRPLDAVADRRLHLLGYVAEERLAALYRGARALVFPSLHEGFGLPPLEAASLGVPVAASRLTVHAEVMGDAALYFDPLDPRDLVETLQRLDRDDALCARLADAGPRRAACFSWHETARRTLEVHHRLVAQPQPCRRAA